MASPSSEHDKTLLPVHATTAHDQFCVQVQAMLNQAINSGLPAIVDVVQKQLPPMVKAFLTDHHQDPTEGEALGSSLTTLLLPHLTTLRQGYKPREQDPQGYVKTNHELQMYALLSFQMACMRLLPQCRSMGDDLDPLPKGVIKLVAGYLGDLQLRQNFTLDDYDEDEGDNSKTTTTAMSSSSSSSVPMHESPHRAKDSPPPPGVDESIAVPMEVEEDRRGGEAESSTPLPFTDFLAQAFFYPYHHLLPLTLQNIYHTLGLSLDGLQDDKENDHHPSSNHHILFRRPKGLPRATNRDPRAATSTGTSTTITTAAEDKKPSKATSSGRGNLSLFPTRAMVEPHLPPFKSRDGRGGSSTTTTTTTAGSKNKTTPRNFHYLMRFASYGIAKNPAKGSSSSRSRPVGGINKGRSGGGKGAVEEDPSMIFASPPPRPSKSLKRPRDDPSTKVAGRRPGKATTTSTTTTTTTTTLPSCILATPIAKPRPSRRVMVIEATPER